MVGGPEPALHGLDGGIVAVFNIRIVGCNELDQFKYIDEIFHEGVLGHVRPDAGYLVDAL